MAAGAAGDLRDLGRREVARRGTVEFHETREGHMVEVHVEPHADRVGRHEVIDLAGLEHADLGIACTRTQGAQHDRRAAALAAHHLRQREDVGHCKGDDGAARRQPCRLFGAEIAQRGEARAGDELGLRHEAAEQRLDGVGAEEHRLLAPARMEEPRREDMAALGIAAELDLVDGQKVDQAVERHRLDRADEIGGVRRDDLLFAGDERDGASPLDADHPVVVLAGEEAEREADHAARMAEHALDGEMRLTRVGGAEDGENAWGR